MTMVGASARAAALGGAATVATGWLAWWLASGTVAHWPGALRTVAVEESFTALVCAAAAAVAGWAALLLARATIALAADAVRGRQVGARGGLTGRLTAGLLLAATLGAAQAGAVSAAPVATAQSVPVARSAGLAEAAPGVAAATSPVPSGSAMPARSGVTTMMGSTADDVGAVEVPVPGWTPTAAARSPRTGTVGEVGLVSTAPGASRPAADEVVVVHAGDTLWDIAARALGERATDQDVAEAWPRWYAANRATIGEDPDLIRPGQQLVAPTEEGDR
ncbi:LysM peptidoglycan-binding domain-containing protein [Ornithinimicrobium avium]|uniref:LysM domain-containing protein n=1 Tax=Ornithinimicrobium avium TaxID=2283195 RepID=A0A345NLB3_9MICO|nr:LysM domain-containing protein [Ornithinimicrobium avium]AXH95821.1 LysM domain-containing protein [Ornithinimicrobium avium]